MHYMQLVSALLLYPSLVLRYTDTHVLSEFRSTAVVDVSFDGIVSLSVKGFFPSQEERTKFQQKLRG